MFNFKDNEDISGISKENLMKGGAFLLGNIKDGMSEKEAWEGLHKIGLNDKECDLVAKAVLSFIKHQKGDHSECGKVCQDGHIDISHRADTIKLIKEFKLQCVKCGSDKISGENMTPRQVKEANYRCPDCDYPIHDSLMMGIEKQFRGKLDDAEVEMFKMGFEWAKVK